MYNINPNITMNKQRTFLALCCMIMTLTAMAQSTVRHEMDAFVERHSENIAAEVYRSSKGTSCMECYRFDLPGKTKYVRELKKFQQLFGSFRGDAYRYRSLTEGMPSASTLRIAYGDNNEFYVDFFNSYKYANALDVNRNTAAMHVRDNSDPSKRYCYVIEWYWTSDRKRLMGSLHIFYGKDPQYVADRPAPSNVQSIPSEDTVYVDDGDVSLSTPQEEAVYITEMKDVFETFLGTVGSIAQEEEQEEEGEFSEATFLKYFGNIRVAIQDNPNNAVKSILTNKMVELCKKYAHVLENTATRNACADELGRLRRYYLGDEYNRALLSIAQDYLMHRRKP